MAPQPAQPPAVRYTLINNAGVSPKDLKAIQDAISAQSLQVRMAWGTPVVNFVNKGGIPIYLDSGATKNPDGSVSAQLSGEHYGSGSPSYNRGPYWNGSPYIRITTGNLPMTDWSTAFSHEVVESLVNPTATPTYRGTKTPEAADPVEKQSYSIAGVPVSNFTTPAYWGLAGAGGATAASGPYDQMGQVSSPYQW